MGGREINGWGQSSAIIICPF